MNRLVVAASVVLQKNGIKADVPVSVKCVFYLLEKLSVFRSCKLCAHVELIQKLSPTHYFALAK